MNHVVFNHAARTSEKKPLAPTADDTVPFEGTLEQIPFGPAPVGAPGTLKRSAFLVGGRDRPETFVPLFQREASGLPEAPSLLEEGSVRSEYEDLDNPTAAETSTTTQSNPKDPFERKRTYSDASEQDEPATPDSLSRQSSLSDIPVSEIDASDDEIPQPIVHLDLPNHPSSALETLDVEIEVDPVPAPAPKKEFHSWTVQLWRHNNVFSAPAPDEVKPEGIEKFKTALAKLAHLVILALVDFARWITGNGQEVSTDPTLVDLKNSLLNPAHTYSWIKIGNGSPAIEDNSKSADGLRPAAGHWIDQIPRQAPRSNGETISTENAAPKRTLTASSLENNSNLNADTTSAAPTKILTVPSSAEDQGSTGETTAEWHIRHSAQAAGTASSADVLEPKQADEFTLFMQEADEVLKELKGPALQNPAAAEAAAPVQTAAQTHSVAKPVLAPAKPKLSKEQRQAEIAKKQAILKKREDQFLSPKTVADRIEANLGAIRDHDSGRGITVEQFEANCQKEGHELARLATRKTATLSTGEKHEFDSAGTSTILDAVSNLKQALNAKLNKTTYTTSTTRTANGRFVPGKEVQANVQAFDLILSAVNDHQAAQTLRDSFNESVLREFSLEAAEKGFVEAYQNAALKFDRALSLKVIEASDEASDEDLFLKRLEDVLLSTVVNQFNEDYQQTGDFIESTIRGMAEVEAAAVEMGQDRYPLIERVLNQFLLAINIDSNLPKEKIREEFESQAAKVGVTQALKTAFARMDRASEYFPTEFEAGVDLEKRQFLETVVYPLFRWDVLEAGLKTAQQEAIDKKGSRWAYTSVSVQLREFLQVLDSNEVRIKLFEDPEVVKDYVPQVRQKIQKSIFPDLVRDAHLQMINENDLTVDNLKAKALLLEQFGLVDDRVAFVQEVNKLLLVDRAEQTQAELARQLKAAKESLLTLHDARVKTLTVDIPAKLDELKAAKLKLAANAASLEELSTKRSAVRGFEDQLLSELTPKAKRQFNNNTDPNRTALHRIVNDDSKSTPVGKEIRGFVAEEERLLTEKDLLLAELKSKYEEYTELLDEVVFSYQFRLEILQIDSRIEGNEELVGLIASMERRQAELLADVKQRYEKIDKQSALLVPAVRRQPASVSSLRSLPLAELSPESPIIIDLTGVRPPLRLQSPSLQLSLLPPPVPASSSGSVPPLPLQSPSPQLNSLPPAVPASSSSSLAADLQTSSAPLPADKALPLSLARSNPPGAPPLKKKTKRGGRANKASKAASQEKASDDSINVLTMSRPAVQSKSKKVSQAAPAVSAQKQPKVQVRRQTINLNDIPDPDPSELDLGGSLGDPTPDQLADQQAARTELSFRATPEEQQLYKELKKKKKN